VNVLVIQFLYGKGVMVPLRQPFRVEVSVCALLKLLLSVLNV
jgi:hypothetical protein